MAHQQRAQERLVLAINRSDYMLDEPSNTLMQAGASTAGNQLMHGSHGPIVASMQGSGHPSMGSMDSTRGRWCCLVRQAGSWEACLHSTQGAAGEQSWHWTCGCLHAHRASTRDGHEPAALKHIRPAVPQLLVQRPDACAGDLPPPVPQHGPSQALRAGGVQHHSLVLRLPGDAGVPHAPLPPAAGRRF